MHNETILELSPAYKAAIAMLLPIVGALIGWFLPNLPNWILQLPFIPFGGLLERLASMDSGLFSIIAACVGAAGGLILAWFILGELLKVTISDQEVKLNIKDQEETFAKDEISAIYMEKKYLVLQAAGGMELYRGEPEAKASTVEEAFRNHGYPWSDEDPYMNDYVRWVADHPDFSTHVNALLAARKRNMNNDESEEAETLRQELLKLGVIVQDREKAQYVRQVRGDKA